MRLGVKTHWRDVATMAAIAEAHGASVLEYQMLPGDLERHPEEAMRAFLPYRGRFELRVHQPERIVVDGALAPLDPASADRGLRDASARALGEIARHAMELRAKALIIHGGGVHAPGERGGSLEALRESLEDVPRHVPLLLENMPLHYGPHECSPAFTREAEGLLAVSDLVDGYTLDTSHGYLAVEGGSRGHVTDLARALGARIHHVHAAGSRGGLGHAGEGVPFAQSDYGVELVAEALAHVARDAVVVPETMDGHRDGGRLFAEDLARLTPVVLSRG